ncbi:hypothetical protein BDZ88DRAFT_504983 [Geranomyces variabilis]|nr:hypothetical protein BDZ88DRAFT_504983 [Geranomyces variabilis]KAJ3132264.1 hypothetical protein HDU90_007456 [Geranomyces variabilis]
MDLLNAAKKALHIGGHHEHHDQHHSQEADQPVPVGTANAAEESHVEDNKVEASGGVTSAIHAEEEAAASRNNGTVDVPSTVDVAQVPEDASARDADADGTIEPASTVALNEHMDGSCPNSLHTAEDSTSEPSIVDLARSEKDGLLESYGDLSPKATSSSQEFDTVENEELPLPSSSADDSLERAGGDPDELLSKAVVDSVSERATEPEIASATFLKHNTMVVASAVREDQEPVAEDSAPVDNTLAGDTASQSAENDVVGEDTGYVSVLDDIYSLTGEDDHVLAAEPCAHAEEHLPANASLLEKATSHPQEHAEEGNAETVDTERQPSEPRSVPDSTVSTVETKSTDLDIVDAPEVSIPDSAVQASDIPILLAEEDDVVANEVSIPANGLAVDEASHANPSVESALPDWELAAPGNRALQPDHDGAQEMDAAAQIQAHREAVVVPREDPTELSSLSAAVDEHAPLHEAPRDLSEEKAPIVTESAGAHLQVDEPVADAGNLREEAPSKSPMSTGAIPAMEDAIVSSTDKPSVLESHESSNAVSVENSAPAAERFSSLPEEVRAIVEPAAVEQEVHDLDAVHRVHVSNTDEAINRTLLVAQTSAVEENTHEDKVVSDSENGQLNENIADERPRVESLATGEPAHGGHSAAAVESPLFSELSLVNDRVDASDEREAEGADIADTKPPQEVSAHVTSESTEPSELIETPVVEREHAASPLPELAMEDAAIRALSVGHEALMPESANDGVYNDAEQLESSKPKIEAPVTGTDHATSPLPELAMEDAAVRALPVAHEALERANDEVYNKAEQPFSSNSPIEAPVTETDHATASLPELVMEHAAIWALPVAHEALMPEPAHYVSHNNVAKATSGHSSETQHGEKENTAEHAESEDSEPPVGNAAERSLPVEHDTPISEPSPAVASGEEHVAPTLPAAALDQSSQESELNTGQASEASVVAGNTPVEEEHIIPEIEAAVAPARQEVSADSLVEDPQAARDIQAPIVPARPEAHADMPVEEEQVTPELETVAPVHEGTRAVTPIEEEHVPAATADDEANANVPSEEEQATQGIEVVDALAHEELRAVTPAEEEHVTRGGEAEVVPAREEARAVAPVKDARETQEIETVAPVHEEALAVAPVEQEQIVQAAETVAPAPEEGRAPTPIEEDETTPQTEAIAPSHEETYAEAPVAGEKTAQETEPAPEEAPANSASEDKQVPREMEAAIPAAENTAAGTRELASESAKAETTSMLEAPAVKEIHAAPAAEAGVNDAIEEGEAPLTTGAKEEASVEVTAPETERRNSITTASNVEDIHPTPPMTPPQRRSSFSQNRLSKSFQRLVSIASTPSASPLSRTAKDGSVLPVSAITTPVHRTNPILEELLYSLNLVSDNDDSLTDLDLSDCPVFSSRHASTLASALLTNDKLKSLSLRSVALPTHCAEEIAEALIRNTTLEVLDLSNNVIAPAGIKALAEMLQRNASLKDLRIANQRAPAGTDAEQALARAMSKNETLTTLRLQVRDVSSRNAIDRCITRNKEIERKKRIAAASQ